MQCLSCGATLPPATPTCPNCASLTPYDPIPTVVDSPLMETVSSPIQQAYAATQPPPYSPGIFREAVGPAEKTSSTGYDSPAYPPLAAQSSTYPDPLPSLQSSSQPKRRSPSSKLVILLTSLIVLILAGGGLLAYGLSLHSNQIRAQMISATATTQSIATATAFAHTPQGIYTTATSGTPAINDPLTSENNSAWIPFAQRDGNGGCAFNQGAFHVTESDTKHFFYCFAGTTSTSLSSIFDNFALQAQMTIIKGDAGGMVLRDQGSQFYTFRITQDGYYSLYRYVDNHGADARLLIEGFSPLIKTGLNQPNIITIIAMGNMFYLYANKQYITQVSDTANTNTNGRIGLSANAFANSTEVAFSNAEVWRLA